MAEVNGKLVTCDRCRKQIFLKTIGDEEMDGGYTRWNKFEDFPEGWNMVGIPASVTMKKSRYVRVCPGCNETWNNIAEKFIQKAEEFLGEAENG
jgi:hypothetical protein